MPRKVSAVDKPPTTSFSKAVASENLTGNYFQRSTRNIFYEQHQEIIRIHLIKDEVQNEEKKIT